VKRGAAASRRALLIFPSFIYTLHQLFRETSSAGSASFWLSKAGFRRGTQIFFGGISTCDRKAGMLQHQK